MLRESKESVPNMFNVEQVDDATSEGNRDFQDEMKDQF